MDRKELQTNALGGPHHVFVSTAFKVTGYATSG
jgi:hypothetical protein